MSDFPNKRDGLGQRIVYRLRASRCAFRLSMSSLDEHYNDLNYDTLRSCAVTAPRRSTLK